MQIDLSNRLVLVTGATSELGRAITRTLGRCGADVVIHYHRNADMARRLMSEVQAMGRRAMTVQADVTDQASVKAMHKQVAQTLGDPDVLVTNAVIPYTWTGVLEQPAEDYQGQFASCVLHNVLIAQAFIPAMIARKWGRVIGINTECAMQCHPSQSAYVSGKRGMDGLLRVLAAEVGPHNITVNQVAPGWMVSDKFRAAGTERQPDYEQLIPLRRRGEDQDVANAVAFLASDLAAFITGVYLPVCGGNVMPRI